MNHGNGGADKKIGLMGGTFDPIHHGHLVTAESVYENLALDRIVFVPAGDPPHKQDSSVTAAQHRLRMVEIATASNSHFFISDIEVQREGPSYTIDTVEYYRCCYTDDTDIYFITGVDAVVQIPQWKNSDGLFELCEIVAATRPGYPTKNFFRFRDQLPAHQRQSLRMLAVPALSISSADLRQRVSEDRSIKYLVPEGVEQYIEEHGLYKSSRSNAIRVSFFE